MGSRLSSLRLVQRHDRDVHDLVGELQLWDLKGFLNDLQQWGLDVPGHLVDLFLDDAFLHFECVDASE